MSTIAGFVRQRVKLEPKTGKLGTPPPRFGIESGMRLTKPGTITCGGPPPTGGVTVTAVTPALETLTVIVVPIANVPSGAGGAAVVVAVG